MALKSFAYTRSVLVCCRVCGIHAFGPEEGVCEHFGADIASLGDKVVNVTRLAIDDRSTEAETNADLAQQLVVGGADRLMLIGKGEPRKAGCAVEIGQIIERSPISATTATKPKEFN